MWLHKPVAIRFSGKDTIKMRADAMRDNEAAIHCESPFGDSLCGREWPTESLASKSVTDGQKSDTYKFKSVLWQPKFSCSPPFFRFDTSLVGDP